MFIVQEENDKAQADIRIIGVGGGGNNMIETMIQEGIKGVEFIAVNTDHQALESSSAKKKIQIGSKLTKGLGAGANPEVGRRASVESYEEIVNCLKGADMIFVTAGMGGGTGTGAAPFIAQSAHELGILTVGIVTKPFLFEGHKRTKQANRGISELSQYVDTLIVVPNEKLLGLADKSASLLETFKITDEVLLQAVKGISELVSIPGLINLDFADIKTVMRDKGMALMGRGCASGSNRAEKALKTAVSSPLLGGLSIQGATGIIVNVTADSSLSLTEFQKASSFITEMADPSADVIVGTVIDENMKDQLSVTVIATGFNNEAAKMDWEALKKPSFKSDSEDLKSNDLNEDSDLKNEIKDERRLSADLTKEGEEKLKQAKDSEKELSQNASALNPQPENKALDPKENLEPADQNSNESEEMDFKKSFAQEESALDENSAQSADQGSSQSSDKFFNASSKKMDFIEKARDGLLENKEEDSSNKIEEKPSDSKQEDKNFKNQNFDLSQQAGKDKKASLREILLSKSKEYQRNQESQSESYPEKQMDMNLKEEHEELSSPFEASVDLSDQDLS